MDKQSLQFYIERAYGGSVPDFDDNDWEEIYREFEETYILFRPRHIVAMRRIQKATEFEMEFRENFIDRHAPRGADGEISEEDWDDVFAIANEEMYRLGLGRIAYYQKEMYEEMENLKDGEYIDNSIYYK
jgi:hypothetical protein